MINLADTVILGVRSLFKFANPTTALVGALWGLAGLLLGVSDRIDQLTTRLAQIVVSLTGVADFSALGVANYLFPLNQLLGYLTSYMALLLACAVIRVIKSFIPTVA
jgi:hypothetical protein